MPKYPLDNATIHGFRGLNGLHLENLGQINVLVGANNSGKTSVLEALAILCNPLEPTEWLAMVRRRDFGGLDETRLLSLRWCFPQSGDSSDPDALFAGQCRMVCDGRFPLRTLTVSYQEFVGEPDAREWRRMTWRARTDRDDVDSPHTERGAEITHVIEADSALRDGDGGEREPIVLRVWERQAIFVARALARRGLIPTDTLTPYSYQINRLQVSARTRRLFDEKSGALVLELVRDFDPDVEAIEIGSFRGDRPALYVKHKRLGPAPLSIFGDALRRAVMLASTLPTLSRGGILLIDEIETGIHVSALRRVFDWLRRWASALEVQVVATTHSLEALDAIALSASDDLGALVTYHLDQTETETRVKRIDGDLLLRLRKERGLDVR